MNPAMSFDSSQADRLLDSVRQGDEQALAALFDHYRPRLETMINLRLDRRLARRVDPADILQEAYVTIERKLSNYLAEEKLPFFLWLRLEVGQKLIDIHRFHLGAKMRDAGQEVSLHRGGMPSVASITLAEQLLGRLSTASRVAMKAEMKIKVQNALNSMDHNDREMLILRHFEELSNSEAAIALGISSTAACNRYVRALKRLKQIFEQMPGGIEGIW
jgi:RNA polymerase sigma-70 factor (ECF subfamily)